MTLFAISVIINYGVCRGALLNRQQNVYSVVYFLFPQKAEDFHLRAVEVGGFHGVNARGVDT